MGQVDRALAYSQACDPREWNWYCAANSPGTAPVEFALEELLALSRADAGSLRLTLPEAYDFGPLHDQGTPGLSPDDFNELLIKCLETPHITFAMPRAISDNRFKRLDLTETREIFGYQPQADAFERFGNISKKRMNNDEK